MNTTPMGQTFYQDEADAEYPQGCQCGETDGGGDCDWCRVYYHGPTEGIVNTQLESRPKQIAADAEKATDLILSGLGIVHFDIRDAVRRAYLLGRTEQAAFSFDRLIKTCRSQAEAKEQG